MGIKCLRCGEPITPETEVCPKCGSGDRQITVYDHAKAMEMLVLKQRAPGYKKFKKKAKVGEKTSRKGRRAREELIIDKEKRRKYHFVEEQNERGEWETVEHHEGPL